MLRVVYNYIFDVTKKLTRKELIPCVLRFIQKNNLKYENLLFELSEYKSHELNKKTYFEKLCESDSFWSVYKSAYICGFVKNTSVIGVSNLEQGEWILKKVEKQKSEKELIEKLQEQLSMMPKNNYRIVFNDMSWFNFDNCKGELSVRGTAKLYPLSSNVTIMNQYPQKSCIILSFEMCSELKEHNLYVEDFREELKCSYTKEIHFVKNEAEEKKYSIAYTKINEQLKDIQNTIICVDNILRKNANQLHIKKILTDVFCGAKLNYEGTGVYEVYVIDKNKNKLAVYFDYDKEIRSLCATLTYKGMGYKYSVRYSEVKSISCDDIIRQYATKVRCEIEKFVNDYVPQIIMFYEPVPDWYEWE